MEPPLPPDAMGGQLDGADPFPIIPLVLHVFPLPGSSDPEERLNDLSLDSFNGAFVLLEPSSSLTTGIVSSSMSALILQLSSVTSWHFSFPSYRPSCIVL